MSLFHKDVTKKNRKQYFLYTVISYHKNTHLKVSTANKTITLRKSIGEEIMKNLAKINLSFNFSIKYEKEN